MKAVIMAGGAGTRLRPLTCNVPKPMVPVVNRPILEHTVLWLKKHEITDIVLLLFYLPDYIKQHFKDGSSFGVNITYVIANKDYATAGAVKQAAKLIEETCLVVSGDVITDIDISRFIRFHHDNKALISMALSQVGNPSPFGIAITNEQGRVTRFLEKPSPEQMFSDRVNMGIYVLEPEALDFIPEDQEYYFAKHLFPEMVWQSQPLYGFITDCYWLDVGVLPSYQQVHRDWFAGKVKLDVKERFESGHWWGRNVQIGQGVKLEGTVVLGDICNVEEGTYLSNSVLGDNCRVGRDCVISNSILWHDVRVGRNATLKQDVIGAHTQIGEGVSLQENVFISNNVILGANSKINAGVRIWSGKEVAAGVVVDACLMG